MARRRQVRVWDLPPQVLCRQHLLAEHRELHGLWNVLTLKKTGYSRHPETLRWAGRLKALFRRHAALAAELARRGWNHRTPLDSRRATGLARQDRFVASPRRQRALLRAKGCACRV